jgi:hypothetical protein
MTRSPVAAVTAPSAIVWPVPVISFTTVSVRTRSSLSNDTSHRAMDRFSALPVYSIVTVFCCVVISSLAAKT